LTETTCGSLRSWATPCGSSCVIHRPLGVSSSPVRPTPLPRCWKRSSGTAARGLRRLVGWWKVRRSWKWWTNDHEIAAMSARALGKMLVGNMIVTAAARYPDRQAFRCGATGRCLTFRETNERSNRLAQGLMDLGLVKGEVAAFLCSNRIEIPEIYF